MHRNGRSARKPKGEGHVRRGEILAAAERIFAEFGYQGATIRKIADEVGVSSTALYMHFREKSEILLEICEQAFAQLIEATSTIAERGGPPEARVREMLDAYMRFAMEHPNAYRLIFLQTLDGDDGADGVAQRLGSELFERFKASVAEIAEQGRLKKDPDTAAQLLWCGAHGVVALLITKPGFDWAPQAALTQGMLDALFEGVVRT